MDKAIIYVILRNILVVVASKKFEKSLRRKVNSWSILSHFLGAKKGEVRAKWSKVK